MFEFEEKRNSAFTLAEVMIVIVIIGVVAVFTMPVLLSEVSERVNSNRQANIAQKVTKAVELMIVNGDYEGFDTTDECSERTEGAVDEGGVRAASYFLETSRILDHITGRIEEMTE